MRRRLIALSVTISFLLVGCTGNASDNSENTTTSSYSSDATSKVSSSKSKIEHYCDAGSCTREGTRSITGISGQKEYYCSTHYNEMVEMLKMFEE